MKEMRRKGTGEVTGALLPAVALVLQVQRQVESDSTNDLVLSFSFFICKVGKINPTRKRAVCINLTA